MRPQPTHNGATLDDVMTELREQRAIIEATARQVNEFVRAKNVSRRDRQRLARILPAAAGVLRPNLFTLREAFEHQAPALRIVLEGETAKALGRLFARATGVPCDGFIVRAQGTERNVTLWQIFQVID